MATLEILNSSKKDSKTEDNVKGVAIFNSSKFSTPRATELTKRCDKEDNVVEGGFMLEDFLYR